MRPLHAPLAVCLLLGALGCATTSHTGSTGPAVADSGPEEADHERCASLCEKQRQCAGEEISEASMAACANGCYRSIVRHPKLVLRLRGMMECLTRTCGDEYEACARRVEGTTRRKSPTPRAEAARALTRKDCRVVCDKTFQCLDGGTMTPEGVDACILGCVHSSAKDNEDGRRVRGTLRCAAVPCGAKYQGCLARPPERH